MENLDGEEGARGDDMVRAERASARPAGERLEEEQEIEVEVEGINVGGEAEMGGAAGEAPEPAGGGNGAEVFVLAGRENPALPQPNHDHVPVLPDGWDAIDRLGAELSFRCRFSLLQEVPEQHKGAWAQGWVKVLRKWHEAVGEADVTRALLWLGFLPQALLRKPSRGGKGGKAARNQIARRFSSLIEGNWGLLVEMFETDLQRVGGRDMANRGGQQDELGDEKRLARQKKEVLRLIEGGQLGKAMNRVTSYGVADINTPAILQQMRDKFPPKWRELPATVPQSTAIDSFPFLREKLLALEPGTSPGCGGCRPEFLSALGERLENAEIELLGQFCLAYTAALLPPWFYCLWLSLEVVPLKKDEEGLEARPLGIRHSLVRFFHKEVATQCKVEVRQFLEPVQLGQSRAGAAKLNLSVRGLLDSHPDWICVSLDMKNCYNAISRSSILEVIVATPELQHLSTFAAAVSAPEPALEARGKVWGRTSEGRGQGDPFSGEEVAIGLQPSLVKLDAECKAGGGISRAGADDVFAVGPEEVVLPAVERFAAESHERCGLTLQWSKSKVYCRQGDLPEAAVALGLSLAGEQVGGQLLRGLMVFGVPVGTDEYIRHKLEEVADTIISDAKKTKEVLSGNRQALWTALRLSVNQRFGYFMQHTPPSLSEPVAARLDKELWKILEAAVGFKIPQAREQGGLHLPLPGCPALDGRSFQEYAVRLPSRLYGWGLRSLEESCGPAYLGTLETAIPFMPGEGGICPQQAAMWGGEECWGVEADPDSRWRTVLSSGSREGVEMRRAWEKINTEASQCAAFLGEEVPEVLGGRLEGFGNGSVTGATRGIITEEIENLRAKVLTMLLEQVRPITTRAAWGWRQRDKVSSAWILAMPCGDTSLSDAEFAEAAASNLCLPSPCCKDRIGEPIRGRVLIDEFGDNVQATALQGDHWRTRHDALKHHLSEACRWAGVRCELEVHNLFAAEMRQPGLSRAERLRQFQAIVPDMRITLPGVGRGRGEGAPGLPAGGLAGQASSVLHEIKVISSSRTRYRPARQQRAVDVRASQLQQEYVGKAKAADRRDGVPPDVVGRVQQKLVSLGPIQGIVAGQFGEVSEPTHSLLDALATSRVRFAGPSLSRRGHMRTEEGERAVAMASL